MSSNGNGLLSGHAHLTARQLEVLRLVAEGRSNAEIARTLYVSPSTVKTTITQLSRRLGARSRAHAVHKGWQNGLFVRATEPPGSRDFPPLSSTGPPVSSTGSPSAATSSRTGSVSHRLAPARVQRAVS